MRKRGLRYRGWSHVNPQPISFHRLNFPDHLVTDTLCGLGQIVSLSGPHFSHIYNWELAGLSGDFETNKQVIWKPRRWQKKR